MMYKKFLTVLLFVIITSPVFSAGSSGGSGSGGETKPVSQYQIGEKMINKAKKFEKKNKADKAQKHYKKAIGYLLKHNKKFPADPNTLNYLGFAHRKIGDYENAEIYYSMGLELDPKHVGINEYMGELFVVTNRLDKAKERLAVLKDCKCKEYKDLKLVIEGKKESKY
ncbi:tetratricopeptide repeat protein [Candidatus Pelagibacter communis]|uniref:tetratricopeptide repeat protein n=1 Tax=Pelagibacter ubique TaxID=198252 RepID=UPI00211C0FDB|nr:tetratricopeptide repeat protein [Candidatus Pelagibacter ubique]